MLKFYQFILIELIATTIIIKTELSVKLFTRYFYKIILENPIYLWITFLIYDKIDKIN